MAKKTDVANKTSSQLIEELGGTKSSAVRVLLKEGYTRSEVAEMLNMRYQHVRNIEITPFKQAKKVVTMSKEFKKMLDEGM